MRSSLTSSWGSSCSGQFGSAYRNSVDYTVTVTDPVNFTKPVTLNRYWLDLGETLVPYNCDERR